MVPVSQSKKCTVIGCVSKQNSANEGREQEA